MDNSTKKRMMRKIITASIVLGLFTVGSYAINQAAPADSGWSLTAQAADVQTTSDGFKYYLNDRGVVIAGYTETAATSISIPSKIGGTNVTTIDDYAFEGLEKLRTVTIPSTVKTINRGAFRNCTALTEITIPNSVTALNTGYGYDDEGIFSHCTSLKTASIGTGVTSIPAAAFDGCSELKTVTLSSSTTSIGEHAFRNCERLSSINFPASLTEIGDAAFSGCTRITKVVINGTDCTFYMMKLC